MANTETVLEPTTLRETLRVYNVHESGQQEAEAEARAKNESSDQHPMQESRQQDTRPADREWPSDWRRMPPYRETSRVHRVSDRAAGQDAVEGVVVMTMFSGVWLLGNINRLWRATAGRWNDQIMRYQIGGEW
ncbi:hypothetical protein PV08_03671 [Exophiala spinifera]|uniref:Uncharacterized protein n=1 Tax=Exophiala spinifera TaxID=91928 RepID=A0A0D1YVR8_9EURO|nr:uncharacterized protein PV08_03671 [Exophiala spinifera]KIW19376.1 hypothetical protein PV08_03671 [Exophiala spinifera]